MAKKSMPTAKPYQDRMPMERKGEMTLPASHTDKPRPGAAIRIKAEAKKKMTTTQWERSETDAMMDRRAAKKSGTTIAKYEASPADEKADAKAIKAHNTKVAAMKGSKSRKGK